MNIPQIDIPPDLPEEARMKVEAVNELLKSVILEMREVKAHPELYTPEQRKDLSDRCGIALDQFYEMREELREYGLEWSEWPEEIE